jgi:hypothetical protein
MLDALPDTTLPISGLGTGSTNGSNNSGGWGFYTHTTGRQACKQTGNLNNKINFNVLAATVAFYETLTTS